MWCDCHADAPRRCPKHVDFTQQENIAPARGCFTCCRTIWASQIPDFQCQLLFLLFCLPVFIFFLFFIFVHQIYRRNKPKKNLQITFLLCWSSSFQCQTIVQGAGRRLYLFFCPARVLHHAKNLFKKFHEKKFYFILNYLRFFQGSPFSLSLSLISPWCATNMLTFINS